jgi:glyoxylase-like metal-dependent hydrolase (beta-lactamase superfamily II)
MKRLHRRDLMCWSTFAENLDIDFTGFVWIREGGNVLIDPLPLSPHDRAHLERLGGAAWIVLTNSDHVRGAADIAAAFGAKIAGPSAESGTFPIRCDRWLADGDEVFPGLKVHALDGSKTPGELCLVLDGTTLIAGDLIRSHRAGSLMLLMAPKLKDEAAARRSIARVVDGSRIEHVLVGDGWHVFGNGRDRLTELLAAKA